MLSIVPFEVCEKAPLPQEVLTSGEESSEIDGEEPKGGNPDIILNRLGNIGLFGIRVDPETEDSYVTLDTSVEPPRLILHNALTEVVFGSKNSEGVFQPREEHKATLPHVVSGVYNGPGSHLELL